MDAVVELHELTKRFGGRAVVDRLSLSVPRGAIYALLGENGAGKTTTLRMLTGLLQPDAGQSRILDMDCWRDVAKLRLRVGYVPERPRFYDWMTVAEIGWFTAGFHDKFYVDRYQERITAFKLNPKARLRQLSKGEYAKVGLALALAGDPEVLILDEPTSGLDLLVRREFLASMAGLAAEGRTIVISSHLITEVERIASHVGFLAHGKLLLAATLEDLRKRVVRFRLHYEEQPPDAAVLGVVLQRNGHGRQWQAVVRDPDREAVETLRAAEGVQDFEELPLGLEEIYCALMAGKEEQP